MEGDLAEHAAPSLVSLSPFPLIPSPSARCLSFCFSKPSRPASLAKRLAWVSLQGRIVNAHEASSSCAIGGGLNPDQAVAWDLFTPFQRILIVAVIGVAVATAESKKIRQIKQLKKSVELRDKALASMQEKLENLCEQMDNIEVHPSAELNKSLNKSVDSPPNETFGSGKMKFIECGCWLCDKHHVLSDEFKGGCVTRVSNGNEMLQYNMPFSNEAEQEERRMSDLSDWASSVTSAADIQMNTLAIEQDIYNLKRDCDEKDASIKKLSSLLSFSEVAGSKRVAELEDVIRRKNMIITKLKKDMLVLEQKVVHLSRIRRPSFSTSDSHSVQPPHMVDNLLYNMDSTTSPSSSDSDSAPVKRLNVCADRIDDGQYQKLGKSTENQKSTQVKALVSTVKQSEEHAKTSPTSPLKETSTSLKSSRGSPSRQKQLPARGDLKKSRRRTLSGTKNAAPHKGWV